MKKIDFKPFDKVLVRNRCLEEGKKYEWVCGLFSLYDKYGKPRTLWGGTWAYIIPYEGNEHLLGTTDDYVPKDGDTVPQNNDFVPKDGDFVVLYERLIAISANACKYKNGGYAFRTYAQTNLTFDGNIEEDIFFEVSSYSMQESIRPATSEERYKFLSSLHNIGKDWNAEKKEIVDWKWIPKRDDTYFFPSFDRTRGEFIVDDVFWESMDEWFDKAHYERGWVFRTKEECQEKCERLNEAIKNVK